MKINRAEWDFGPFDTEIERRYFYLYEYAREAELARWKIAEHRLKVRLDQVAVANARHGKSDPTKQRSLFDEVRKIGESEMRHGLVAPILQFSTDTRLVWTAIDRPIYVTPPPWKKLSESSRKIVKEILMVSKDFRSHPDAIGIADPASFGAQVGSIGFGPHGWIDAGLLGSAKIAISIDFKNWSDAEIRTRFEELLPEIRVSGGMKLIFFGRFESHVFFGRFSSRTSSKKVLLRFGGFSSLVN